ncbi:MAG: ATP synthase F0 subunit C [Chloroflexi bacterium]|nr:ATP synthase F0 subunit C [Chloroflexota bacterium]
MEPEVMKLLAVGMIGSLGLLGPAIGLGFIGYSALAGIARNPEASGRILTNMILIGAFTEAIGIYALVLAIILVFVG